MLRHASPSPRRAAVDMNRPEILARGAAATDGGRIGVLIVNLGTPDATDPASVRRYLREFLADPFVIDLPWLTRKILLHAVILPFRTKKTTHAYQQVWTEDGSPFLVNSR